LPFLLPYHHSPHSFSFDLIPRYPFGSFAWFHGKPIAKRDPHPRR
jgi:hypothetical protein